MKKGFALLEVMIASLIAGLLATGLLVTIGQVTDVQKTMDTISAVYARVAILQQQMERDLMGAFVPTQVDLVQITTDRAKETATPLAKVFYGTTSGENLELLTCITSNPMQIYLGIKDTKPKPRVARVIYRLIPDTQRKNSFVLTRQEGTVLAFDQYKKDAQGAQRAYPMIDGIQSLSVQYGVVEEKRSDDGKTSKLLYKKQKRWETPKPQTDPKKRRESIHLPNMVEVQLVLWDSVYKKTRSFGLVIPIVGMSGVHTMARDEKKPDAQAEKTQEQKDRPPAQKGGGGARP